MEIIKDLNIFYLIRALVLIFIGLPAIWFSASFIKRVLDQRISANIALLISNIIFYLGIAFIGITLLQEVGFNISAFLGAAGVAGVAVGFAAKTTFSNLISGVFILLERSIKVGDYIICGGNTGIVESIDLMSVKLRTINGKLVRIPNEILVSQSMINSSYYPQQRLIFKAEIQPNQDIMAIRGFLEKIVVEEPLILTDPKPTINVRSYNQYAIELRLCVWVKRKDTNNIYSKLAEKTAAYGHEKNIWIGLTQE